MTTPRPDASKTEWRAWARHLAPVPADVASLVSDHVADFVGSVNGVVLGYRPLPDEVPLDLMPDAVAVLDADGALLLDGCDGPLGADDVDIVLVPARVFDRAGYRLGRGGGHYDRLLTTVRRGIPVVGVTCTARIVARLPREPHDIPMTHLATETGVVPADSGS